MKTKVVTLVSILLLSCTAAFVSCKKNDNTGDSQQQATIKFDDATYIMSQFAEWDDDGNLLFRTKGYTLNEADDTEVSLCVETWGEALSMFKEWMPEGADYTETATSLTWRMTDGFGKPQGEAVLNKVTNGTMVAEAKLPSNIPFVRTIRFIPKDKWPENKNDFVFFDIISADDLLADYWAGNIVEIEKPTHHGTGKFVVMRDFDNETNEKGLLMRLPKNHKSDLVSETLTGGWESIRNRCSKVGVVKTLRDIYRADMDFWDPIMEKADFDTRDYHYFCWDGGYHWWYGYQYQKVNFKTGDRTDLDTWHPNFRECWAYHFWLEKDKNGVLQLIIK